jgi:hypothetical protein
MGVASIALGIRRDGARGSALSTMVLLGLVSIPGCGGGGGEGGGGVASCQWGDIAIDTPTYAGTWDTDASSIDLGGSAPTPGGPYSSHCSGDPGYTITWRNDANGATGTGGASSSLHWTYIFGWVCTADWSAHGIPLVMGDNPITVTLAGAGQDCIVVSRHPDTTPPTVSSTSPSDGEVNVAVDSAVAAHFSEPVDPATVTSATFSVSDRHGGAVDGAVTIDAPGAVTFHPSNVLAVVSR